MSAINGFMSLQSAVMGRVRVRHGSRLFARESVGDCRKGTEMVGTTSSPTRIFFFEGGGIIWKKKKKNGRDKVVCFDNKTGWSMYHSLALSLEEHNFDIHDTEGFDLYESDRNSCPNTTPLFAFQPITTGDVHKIIKSLPSNKAPGCDKVNAKILKDSSPVIAPIITSLIN